jgi:hypothetical protein
MLAIKKKLKPAVLLGERDGGVQGGSDVAAPKPPCEQVLAAVGAGAGVHPPGVVHTHQPPYEQLLVGVVGCRLGGPSPSPPPPSPALANSTTHPTSRCS